MAKSVLRALICAVLGGIVSVVVGESIPRKWFHPEKRFWQGYSWERGGQVYRMLGVHRWKDFMPDLSRVLPGLVRKKAGTVRTSEEMDRLVRETCEAELIHWALILFVSPVIALWASGIFGIAAAVLYALGNLVFVIIQRYNRPRLIRLRDLMKRRERKANTKGASHA